MTDSRLTEHDEDLRTGSERDDSTAFEKETPRTGSGVDAERAEAEDEAYAEAGARTDAEDQGDGEGAVVRDSELDEDNGLVTTTPPAPAPSLVSEPVPAPAPVPTTDRDDHDHFLPAADTDGLRDRWLGLQSDFVDDPRHAVEEADALLEQVVSRFTESLAADQEALRGNWKNGAQASAAHDDALSTEQLRTTLQDYRRMMNRLLDA